MLNQKLYQNHMVIQQNESLHLVGHYQPNVVLNIKIYHQGIEVYAHTIHLDSHGVLDLYGPSLKASRHLYHLTIQSDYLTETIYFYVGDLILGIGQSNMQYPLKFENERQTYLDQIKNHQISIFHIDDALYHKDKVIRPTSPLNELITNTSWSVLNKDNALAFSALLIMFAIEYGKTHDYPIGIIDASVGGSSIQGYLPIEAIEGNLRIQSYLKERKVLPHNINQVSNDENHYTLPSGIYNEKIYALRHLSLKIIIWYQGEHHVGQDVDAIYYYHALNTLIDSYRRLWNNQNLDWVNIQIQNCHYEHDDGDGVARINYAISCVSNHLAHTYVIPVHDQKAEWINAYTDETAMEIHPTNKAYIAKRIVDCYVHRKLVPYIESYEIVDNQIIISLKHFNKVISPNDLLKGFVIIDSDTYYSTEVKQTKNNQLIISSKYIEHPKHFAYGFGVDHLEVKLFNEDLLPLLCYSSNLKF